MASKDKLQTWLPIGSILISLMTLLILVLNTVVGDRINTVIQASPYLSDKFSKTDLSLKEITNNVNDLKLIVNSLKSDVERLKDPRVVFDSLKKAARKDNASLVAELPRLRQALRAMRENKNVKVPEYVYKETSVLYIKRYSKAPEPVKNEIWQTFVEMATTKSVTDGLANPITDVELQKAERTKNLFDTGIIDLSQRERWSGTIFKNCKITVSRPKQTLSLVRVRFIDVDFESLPRNQSSENLVAALVSSDSPSISKTVISAYRVTVVPCCLKPEVTNAGDKISLLRRNQH